MAVRLLDYVMALDKKSPLTIEVDANSPFLDFLSSCSFTESEEDRKYRKANKEVVIIKMKRGTKKEEENE